MNFFNYKATQVWFADSQIWIKLEDDRLASSPISQFPILAKATQEQLLNFEIIGGYALHWPDLDEDLSVAGFFETNTNSTEETDPRKILQTS